jgi:4-cresol dehydrogenase (hydroxylating)
MEMLLETRPETRKATVGAVERWREVLGAEYVVTQASSLAPVQTATFATTQQVPVVLRPANRSEVQAVLRIANEFKTPVYPVSTGKNWGYGSAVPVKTQCAILELSRLNRISNFDEKLGCITVEPGVTQRQLYAFLQERKAHFWMDATGASLDTSIVGNTMERGFGHTPYGDHVSNICGLEVVLPTSECIHTGFRRFENAKAAHVYRWGVGPNFDSMFAQSNFGIVTEMTLWLMPEPECFQAFYFSVDHDSQLEALVDALAPLRLDGTIKSALHIGNDYKVLSSIQQYPWKETSGATPLPPSVLADFRKRWDFGAWNGSGALYGSRDQVAAARKRIVAALRGKVKRIRFLDDRKLRIADFVRKPYQWLTGINLTEMLKVIRPVYGLMKGIPTNAMLPSTYWRKKTPPPAPSACDPNHDRCGLLWLAPVSPTNGECAREMARIVTETAAEFGFEPSMSMTMISERALDNVVSISYDREVPGEDARAMSCHDKMLQRLTAAGYYPYRLGVQSMHKLPAGEASYDNFASALKQTLDPNGILAPGRYTASRKLS